MVAVDKRQLYLRNVSSEKVSCLLFFPLPPFLNVVAMFASLFLALALAISISAQQNQLGLFRVTDYGPNARGVELYLYFPLNLPPNPPVLVVAHDCHERAIDPYLDLPYAFLADEYGFVVIYPQSPNKADQCWDVSSNASLTHNGGGDALDIVDMVRWALEDFKGDKERVFVTGTGSGAMMAEVLLGSYPDVFAAGSAWAGVPFGCFAGNGFGIWNDACATGKITKTGTEWADIVRRAYPGYTGARPKVQVVHGTADTVVSPQNLKEEIKQWTSVLGVSETPTETTKDTPLQGWTRYRYGSSFEAYEAAGVGHNIANQADIVVDFFGLRCNATAGEPCFSRSSR